jgi:hypothetical protein
MRWTRDRWIRFLFAGFCITAAHPGLGAAHAQGFGPDPFRPYNSQYDQYVYPIRPETGGAAAPARGLARGQTPFERWLNEQEAGSRLATERYGAGVPHWKVRTDYEQDKRELARKRRARSEPDLASITQKYLAYFSEENPSKRAILLREYDPSTSADDAELLDEDNSAVGRRGRAVTRGRAGAPAARGTLEKADEERGARRIPPPPALRGAARGSSRSTRRPSDILDRSLRLDDDDADSPRLPSIKRPTRRPSITPAPDE